MPAVTTISPEIKIQRNNESNIAGEQRSVHGMKSPYIKLYRMSHQTTIS